MKKASRRASRFDFFLEGVEEIFRWLFMYQAPFRQDGIEFSFGTHLINAAL